MSIIKLVPVICSMMLLGGCVLGTSDKEPLSNQTVAKGSINMGDQEEITLSGRAEPYQEVVVSSSMAGKLKSISADVGAYIKQGDLLVELDEGNLSELVKKADDQIKVVEAQGNLTAMEQQIALNKTIASTNQSVAEFTASPPQAPTPPEMSGFPELEAAETAVKDAELALAEIEKEWTTTNELFEHGLVSQEELDRVTSAKDKAKLQLERAEKKVVTETEKIELQTRYEQEKAQYEQEKEKYEQARAQYEQEVKKASEQTQQTIQDTIKLQQESSRVASQTTQIAIKNAKSELEAVKSQYDKLSIIAPVNGFITEKKIRVGEMVSQGSTLFVITNLDQLYVTIHVPEAMINRWKGNQSVSVNFPTQDITKEGEVAFVSLLPNKEEKTYPVKVLIDNEDHKIRGGMQAVVTWRMQGENTHDIPSLVNNK